MTIRIKQVVPITGDILLDKDSTDFISKYLSEDTIMETSQISEGRVSIEGEYDEIINTPHVVELCKKAEREGCHGIFVDCFGDPGVRAARECVDIPVFGGFEPAMLMAMGLGDKISIVTVLKNVVPLIEGEIAKSHFDDRVASIRVVNMPVMDLDNHEKLCNKITEESEVAIEQDGASVIVLGCTGMVDVADTVRESLLKQGYDVPVIEPAHSALNLLELYAKMNLKQSRITYMKPREK